MSWARLDDAFPDHPKVAALSAEAFRVHVSAICYAARFLTDGRIPRQMARRWADPEVIEELVAGGLWEVDADGYAVHDYLDFNPSRETVEKAREAKVEAGRQRALSRNGSTRSAEATAPATADGEASAEQYPVPIPVPLSPSDAPARESGADAPDAPAVADAAPVSEPIPKPTPSRRRPRPRAPNELPIAEARPLTTDAVDEIAARHGRELTDEVVAYWLNDSRFQTQRDKPAFIETKVIQRKGWVPNGGSNGRTNGTQRSPGGRAASGPATVADVERWLATH